MRRFALLSLVVAVGCKPGEFKDFQSDTPVRAIRALDAYPRATFGTVLTSYQGTSGGVPYSRLVVSSGDYLDDGVHASVWSVLGGWRDTSLRLGETIDVNCNSGSDMCAPGEGASLSPLFSFGEASGCVMAGAPFANEVRVTCESSTTLVPFNTAGTDERFGAAVAAIPEASTVGLAFIGAPNAERIALVRGPTDQLPATLDFGGEYVPADGSGFGETLAVATLPESFRDMLDDEVLLVVGEPSTSRVVLALVATSSSAGGAVVTEVLGCIDRPTSPSFGSVLAAGDLTGDGIPEVLIGARLDVADRVDEIMIVSADQLSGRVGCDDETDADDKVGLGAQTITCDADGAMQGFECAGAGLGSAFAIGDVDGAGSGELLVGVPLAAVDQVAHAGVAFVFPSVTSIDGLVAYETLMPLVNSSPSVNDTLGFAVTFLPTQLGPGMSPRAEPVVSAPGGNRVYVYLCSGLPGDSLADGVPRCLVEE